MIHFRHCGCDAKLLDRQPRSWWMRAFFPSRGLFRCLVCHTRMLLATESPKE